MSTTTETRVDQARTHLETLYGNADRGVAVLFLIDEGVSRFYDIADPGALDTMAEDAVRLSDSTTVYFGVNLIAKKLDSSKRGATADVLAVVGLVNDCDIRPGDPTKPQNMHELGVFAKTLPLAPSLVVRSGGGAHLYTLFSEPYVIETDGERDRLHRIAKSYGRFVQHKAAEYGWTFDAVADLARVLRLPGTLNRKPVYPAPIPVELVNESGARYELSDVEDILPDSAFDDEPLEAPEEGSTVLSEKNITKIVDTLRPVPRENNRHALSLYLGGWLANNQIAESSAVETVKRVSQTGGDDDGDQKVKNVRDSYASLRDGRRPLGWTGLKQLHAQGQLTQAQLDALDKVLKITILAGGKTFTTPGGAAQNGRAHATDGGAKAHSTDPETGELWRDRKDLPPLSEVPPMPPELIPEPIRPWLLDSANIAKTPVEMTAIPAIVGLGSVIGRLVGIRPWRFDNFVTVPNVWGAVVARSGLMKTHGISEGLNPIGRLAAAEHEAFEERKDTAAAEVVALEAKLKATKNRMEEAAKNGGTLDDLKAKYAEITKNIRDAKATERRFMTHDATVEKLGELVRENPNGMLVVRDELYGLLRSFEKSGRETDRQFYLEAWNGTQPFTSDRIGRGTIYIPCLTLSIVGGIQPGRLQGLIDEATSGGSGDDGLLQRFQLLVWLDKFEAWAKPTRYLDKESRDRAYGIFNTISQYLPHHLSAKSDYEGEIPYLEFTPLGQTIADTWRAELEPRLRSNELDASPAFASHLSKYRSLMPELALIFHLVDVANKSTPAGPINEGPARLAAEWCSFLELHARKIYAVELDRGVGAARALVKKITDGAIIDGQSVREIYRHHWSGLSNDEVVIDGLAVLAKLNWVRFEPVATGGRSMQIIRLHPELRQGMPT